MDWNSINYGLFSHFLHVNLTWLSRSRFLSLLYVEHSRRQTVFNSKANGLKDIKQGVECASRSITFPIRSVPLNQLLPVACQHPGAAELADWACDSLSTCTLQNFVQLAGTWKKVINRERSHFLPCSGLNAKQQPLFFFFSKGKKFLLFFVLFWTSIYNLCCVPVWKKYDGTFVQ